MTLAEALLAILVASEPWYEDRAEQGRLERLTTLAIAITDASQQDPKMAALVTMAGFWESRWNLRVHAGQCRRWECDPISHRRIIRHTSITPWQLKQWDMPSDRWLAMVGTELVPTTLAARESARRLTLGIKRCRSIPGAINMYAIGKCSGYYQAEMRLESYRKILGGIERRMAEPSP